MWLSYLLWLKRSKIQLISQLTQNAEAGKEGTVQSSEQIELTLDENLNQAASKSAEIIQAQQTNLTTHTSTLSAHLREKLSAISTSVNTTSDQLIQLSISTLTDSQKELSKIISDTNLAIDEDKEKLRTAFGQDIEQNFQSYVKSLNLIKYWYVILFIYT